jgi:hypothetical protein
VATIVVSATGKGAMQLPDRTLSGGPGPVIRMNVRCLRGTLLSGTRLPLPLDRHGARRVKIATAILWSWTFVLLPLVILLYVVQVVLVAASLIQGSEPQPFVGFLPGMLGTVLLLLGVLAATVSPGSHYPRLIPGSQVEIRDVDETVAEEIARLNPSTISRR